MPIFGIPDKIKVDVNVHFDPLEVTWPNSITVKFPDAILVGSTPITVQPIKVEISQVDDDAEAQAALDQAAADLKQSNDDLSNAQK